MSSSVNRTLGWCVPPGRIIMELWMIYPCRGVKIQLRTYHMLGPDLQYMEVAACMRRPSDPPTFGRKTISFDGEMKTHSLDLIDMIIQIVTVLDDAGRTI